MSRVQVPVGSVLGFFQDHFIDLSDVSFQGHFIDLVVYIKPLMQIDYTVTLQYRYT